MPVDDKKIDEALEFTSDKLKKLAEIQTVYSDLHHGLISIQKSTRTVQNNTGGTDKIQVIPNKGHLKESDNNKIRQIVYDDCIAKYAKLKSDKL